MNDALHAVPTAERTHAAAPSWRPPQAVPPGSGVLSKLWRRLLDIPALANLQRKDRRLVVKETVSLGDKRFVSILEVDGQSFLIGGGTGQISLLSALPTPKRDFEQVLTDVWQEPKAR